MKPQPHESGSQGMSRLNDLTQEERSGLEDLIRGLFFQVEAVEIRRRDADDCDAIADVSFGESREDASGAPGYPARTQRTIRQTVVYFSRPKLKLPVFTARPMTGLVGGVMRKVLKFTGGPTVHLPAYADFNQRFTVMSFQPTPFGPPCLGYGHWFGEQAGGADPREPASLPPPMARALPACSLAVKQANRRATANPSSCVSFKGRRARGHGAPVADPPPIHRRRVDPSQPARFVGGDYDRDLARRDALTDPLAKASTRIRHPRSDVDSRSVDMSLALQTQNPGGLQGWPRRQPT
jgi:hypothetical protein